jgi:hypothetical protein
LKNSEEALRFSDGIAELALQVKEDIGHPNDSATNFGFENSKTDLENGYTYNEVVARIDEVLREACDYAAALNSVYGDDNADGLAIQNFLGDFLQRWTKELNYKNRRRLDSSRNIYNNKGRWLFSALPLVNDLVKDLDWAVGKRTQKELGKNFMPTRSETLVVFNADNEAVEVRIMYTISGETPIRKTLLVLAGSGGRFGKKKEEIAGERVWKN